jgi:hypothetical protein
MNETLKKILVDNAGALIVALGTVFLALCGFILSLRADVNSTQFQVQALQQSTSPITSLVPEVAAIKQASIDTNEKVNALYSHFIK